MLSILGVSIVLYFIKILSRSRNYRILYLFGVSNTSFYNYFINWHCYYQLLCLPYFGSYRAIITDISRCYKNNNCHKKETINYREESQRLRNLIFPYSNFLFNYSRIQPCSRVEITRLTYQIFSLTHAPLHIFR
jgi:hypothetical protein